VRRGMLWSTLLVGLVLIDPGSVLAQTSKPLEFGGLLRTGFRVDPDET